MRSITIIATTVMLMVALSAGAAFAATIVGHPWAGTLTGTAKTDTIRGEGGSDALIGKAGDGKQDIVDCGSGVDVVNESPTEQLDRFVGCERFVN
jgi:Ca2+-binding RTX toxin-like protein